MMRNKKKWFGAKKNESEEKKMVRNGKKWFGTKKNELDQKTGSLSENFTIDYW
jgi:hypothetical protein